MARLKDWIKYYSDKKNFLKLGGKIDHSYPLLTDWRKTSGTARGQYFHQDLLVASYIYQRNPDRHMDVGSRVDGFVAHVASFREIEVCDIRPQPNCGHPNIRFVQLDITKSDALTEKVDSLSCLHALEHFGLGRYGDPVDPVGHKKGFANLLGLLRPGGFLYLGIPIGKKSEVFFNAHRVFHPMEVFDWASRENFALTCFDYVDDSGELHRGVDPSGNLSTELGCGIYSFSKPYL
jgi:hypothetical protein